MNQFKPEGFHIIGLYESMESADPGIIDIFYRLSPEIWKKYPGPSFFKFFHQIENELKINLGVTIDLVDVDSLAPIGQEGILSKIHYID